MFNSNLTFYDIFKISFRFKKFSLNYLNMTKTFHLNYRNIPGKFNVVTVSDLRKLPLLNQWKCSLGSFEDVTSTKSFSVASDAVPINIFKGDYADLKY